jgi:hypothetical protein
VHKRIISAAKRVEFVSDRMLYIILRGRWCHINSFIHSFIYCALQKSIYIGIESVIWYKSYEITCNKL